MSRVVGRIIELATHGVGAVDAVPRLVDKVLARAVLEHVRATGVAVGLGTLLFGVGAGEKRVIGTALGDGDGRLDGGRREDEDGEGHEDGEYKRWQTHVGLGISNSVYVISEFADKDVGSREGVFVSRFVRCKRFHHVRLLASPNSLTALQADLG